MGCCHSEPEPEPEPELIKGGNMVRFPNGVSVERSLLVSAAGVTYNKRLNGVFFLRFNPSDPFPDVRSYSASSYGPHFLQNTTLMMFDRAVRMARAAKPTKELTYEEQYDIPHMDMDGIRVVWE